MIKENYFVLTGAMGAGKTSILSKLREENIKCVDEPARIILKEQRLKNGAGVPEKNAELFTSLMLKKMISDYEKYVSSNENIIFDRGIPDIIAYAGLLSASEKEGVIFANKLRYNKFVFWFSGVEEIYVNDDERKIDFKSACSFGESVKRIYLDFQYTVIDVPFASIDERALFIIEKIKAL